MRNGRERNRIAKGVRIVGEREGREERRGKVVWAQPQRVRRRVRKPSHFAFTEEEGDSEERVLEDGGERRCG